MFPEFLHQIDLIRDRVVENINFLFPSPQAEILQGVLLGIKADISKDLYNALVSTGTIHVVVVSGYNLSIITGWLSKLEGYISKKILFVLMVLCVILFTMLTGSQAPTIRAAILCILAYTANLFGRLRNSLYLLFLTGVIMVIVDREVLTSISFQLSFLATLGILLFSDFFRKFFARIPSPFGEDLSASLAAQIMVVPLIVYYFGSVSVFAPIINALILWTIPLITMLGYLTVSLSFLVLPLAQPLAWITLVPITIFYEFIKLCTKIPFLQFFLPKNNLKLIIGSYLIVLGIVFILRSWNKVHEESV